MPVCIAATWAIMFLLGIELNTVTLAALIVVLGMIVDDSVVVIDGYSEMLATRHSRWYCATVSTKTLLPSMLISTCSVSFMFFPMLALLNGSLMGDFVKLFPWTIFIALTCSFLFAIWVIPFLSARIIKPSDDSKKSLLERIQSKFFNALQNSYKRLLDLCFRHKWGTIIVASLTVLVGVFLFTKVNVQMLPKAERDSFAVEIHLATGSSINETGEVVDSLTKILQADPRVKSITAFVGMASPRFHMTYAPEAVPTKAYAQFIVNTVSDNATKEMMKEYSQRYENYFPVAQIRFKQMDYQVANAPIEYYIVGNDYDKLSPVRDSLIAFMKQDPNLFYVHSDYDGIEEIVEVDLNIDEANRLGVTQAVLSVYLASALSGSNMVSMWENGYNLPTKIYTEGLHDIDYEQLGDMLVPTTHPGVWVPLRQIAILRPSFAHDNLTHRNGMRCITVLADVMPDASQMAEFKKINNYLKTFDLPEGVRVDEGGSKAITRQSMPSIIQSIIAAIVVMFIVLIIHFQKIGISFLSLSVSVLCVFGASFGLWLFGLDVSVTAMLGIISLIGIIVRNAIIMYDYAAELRTKNKLSAHEAAYEAGLRRMRPIFLTSATTALGVVPMIIAKTLLWEPMGVVICFGTILTFPLVVTVLPVAYCLAFDAGQRDMKRREKLNKSFLKKLDERDMRNAKRNVITVLLVVFSLTAVAQSEPLTLDSCFALAKANNVKIKTSKLEIEKAKEVKAQVYTKYFPQVSLSMLSYYAVKPIVEYGVDDLNQETQLGQLIVAVIEALQETNPDIPTEINIMKKGIGGSAMAVMPVYAGGRIVNGNKLANLGIEAAELKSVVSERDLLEEIESSYYLVLGLQEKVQTLNTALTLIDSLDHTVDVALQAGLITNNDKLRVAMKRNEFQAKQMQLNNGILLASLLLCHQIGIAYPEQGLVLENNLNFTTTPSDAEISFMGRPERRLLQLQIEAEKFYKKLTIGETLPQVGVGSVASYGNMSGKTKFNNIFFANISMPLTKWWETSHKVKVHDLKIKEAELMQEDLNGMMDLQEKQAYNQMIEAEALLRSDYAAHDMAEENYRLANLNYCAGMNTIADVLEANALLLQSQNAITDRQITFASARRRYHDLTGK